MKILLLNLTRFGDLLQSQAAITDLTRQGHEVAVVCLENFAAAAALLQGVSQIFPFSSSSLLMKVVCAENGRKEAQASVALPWHEALSELAAWRNDLHAAFQPDHLCNFTPSLSARMLSFFMSRGVSCSGFGVDEYGFGVNGNSWASFLQGASLARQQSPFNVVDVFRRIASPVQIPSVEGARGEAELTRPSQARLVDVKNRLRRQAPENCKGFVGFQLGASEDRRRWPVASFAALGDILWREEGLCPVILGSKAELPLAESYARAALHPHISMCGQTNLGDLACVLCATELLVSNDTGTMHLAAGLGLPILAIFLATAQPFDTGPYLEGSCCIEPDMACHPCAFGIACERKEACRHAVGAEFMGKLALERLRRGRWIQASPPGEFFAKSSARVWVSEFDSRGFMSLRSVSGHDQEARIVWLKIQRRLIREYLDRDLRRDFQPPLPDREDMPPLEGGAEVAAVLERANSLVELLQQQGKVLVSRPMPLMRDRFLATWQKLLVLLRGNAWCGSLALLWAQDTQAEGQDLPVVLARARQFQQLLQAFLSQLTK